MKPPQHIRSVLAAGEMAFMFLFLIEWLLRLYVDGKEFLFAAGTYWNWFDTAVVSMQVTDHFLMFCVQIAAHSSSFSVIRVLRLLRLLRILRVVRLLHLFDELDMLVRSISLAVSPLMWAIFLMLTMIYTFSIFFVQRTLEVDHGNLSPDLVYFFGGI